MAWRPTEYLIEGELDNTNPGRVTGWMKFAGKKEKVTFDLKGDFHRDIRGAKIYFINYADVNQDEARSYMESFASHQTGNTGDITAGLPPKDYVGYPYIEWYSEENGRVVLELEPSQIEIIGTPIPALESNPVSRKEQAENMANFLCGMASGLGISEKHTIATGHTMEVEHAKKVVANNKLRGMKLLPKEIREKLPTLYSQENKGGKAIVYVKFFTPDSNWTWWATEGEPVLDESGKEVDFRFFGLVDGHEKELGYFVLSELEEVQGPMGLPIERDLFWQPKTLEEVAPEMFKEVRK
jgi:hypothetical protein